MERMLLTLIILVADEGFILMNDVLDMLELINLLLGSLLNFADIKILEFRQNDGIRFLFLPLISGCG